MDSPVTQSRARGAKAPASREKLLRAAEQIIVEEGLKSLTTRRLQAVAGVNTNLIVYNFGGLDQLIEAVFNANFERMIEAQSEIRQGLAGGTPSLAVVLESVIRPIFQPPVYYGQGRGSVIVQEIYAYAHASVKDAATSRMAVDMADLIDFAAPMVSDLDRATLIWRLCFIFASAMALTPASATWQIACKLGDDMDGGVDRMVQELIAFALAGLRL